MRQIALSAGLGPKLKKRNLERSYYRDENEGNDGKDILPALRNGAAAENAVALMQERGYANQRRSRHRLIPGTVKFPAFHVLALEGSISLKILDIADKIQKPGLRDLTTSKAISLHLELTAISFSVHPQGRLNIPMSFDNNR